MPLSAYLREHRERHLNELFELLRIPSVSSDSRHGPDMRRAAEFTAAKLEAAGFDARVMDTPGHPVVYGEHAAAPDAPTVLVYGHYDVQPPDPLELWNSPPFEPVIEGGAIVARGAMDNKGQIYAHIKGAAALLAVEGSLPVNLKFLIEGEEEIGSPNLDAFLEANRELLACDAVVISDGAMIAPETPTITYAHKGLAYIEVHVRGASMDLHSGTFGGAVPNPINALARMIGRLHDERGRVAVPGFYDGVVDLDEGEREAFGRVPFDEREFAEEIGVGATPGEEGYSVLERIWARPTLDVNGISGGFEGEGAKTVIASRAMAKISCRLVPEQTHESVTAKLERYLEEIAPPGVTVEVRKLAGSNPARVPLDSPAVRAAATALRSVYGKSAVFARSGGSLPIISALQDLLGADVVLVGLGLETDRIHSPNEKFDLVNYFRGIETSAALWKALGERRPAG